LGARADLLSSACAAVPLCRIWPFACRLFYFFWSLALQARHKLEMASCTLFSILVNVYPSPVVLCCSDDPISNFHEPPQKRAPKSSAVTPVMSFCKVNKVGGDVGFTVTYVYFEKFSLSFLIKIL